MNSATGSADSVVAAGSGFEINKTAVVRSLFSFSDWTWPGFAAIAVGAIIFLDTTLDMSVTGTDQSFNLSGGPFMVFFTVGFVVVATVQSWLHFKTKAKLAETCTEHEQYLTLSPAGLAYGYRGAAEFFWSWDTVAHARRFGNALILRMGRSRVKIHLDMLEAAEVDDLIDFLVARGLMKPPKR